MTTPSPVIDERFETYWAAVARGDERAAQAVAVASLEGGTAVEDLLRDLVVAAQLRVGELWAANHWTVSREHAATAVGESVVRRIAAQVPEPTDGPVVVVGCVEREWHALPALVVAHTLRSRGLRVTYLGASATRDLLVSRIADHAPRAVLLSASLSSSLPRARRHVDAIRGTGTPVVVGGRAFDPAGVRAARLGATAYAAGPAQVLDVLPSLPHRVPPNPPLHHAAAAESRQLQANIEKVITDVTEEIRDRLRLSDGLAPDDWAGVLLGHVPHVVDSLAGALIVQDPTVVSEARTWLVEVLDGRGADAGVVDVLWAVLAERLRTLPQAVALLSDC